MTRDHEFDELFDRDPAARWDLERENFQALAAGEVAGRAPRARRQEVRPSIEELIDFEAEHADTRPGRKELLVLKRWNVRPTRYQQMLIAAIRTPEALTHDPITTNRLLAQLERRIAARKEHRFS